MAKETFHNLSSEKREKILDVLKTVFREKPFHEVTVKEIVEESGIAREALLLSKALFAFW